MRLTPLWQEDLISMVETHLFCPLFPKEYLSKKETMSYFMKTLKNLIKKSQPAEIAAAPSTAGLEEVVGKLRSLIQTVCQPLNDFLASPALARSFDTLFSENIIQYTCFAEFLRDVSPGCFRAQDLNKQLPKIQKEFEDSLTNFLHTVPLEVFQQHKREWIKQLNKDYIDAVGQLFVLITYFRDLDVLFDKMSFLKDWDYVISPELKNMLSFFGRIQKLFDRTETKKRLALPEAAPSLPSLSPPPEVADSPASPPPVLTDKVETEPPAPPKEVSENEELLKELKEAAKRREFAVILRKLGFDFFRYGKGSHEIWENANKDIVVLPFHNEKEPLKPGTQHAIVKQVKAALEKPKKDIA
jgi:predicted RNA binding protein YcfA (HicA-like mRNA interferase family)